MNFIEGQVAASPRATGMATPRESAAIFYPRLEALRGVAALTVAAFHSWQSPWLNSVGQSRNFLSAVDGGTLVENLGAVVLRVVGNGYGAVVLFFGAALSFWKPWTHLIGGQLGGACRSRSDRSVCGLRPAPAGNEPRLPRMKRVKRRNWRQAKSRSGVLLQRMSLF